MKRIAMFPADQQYVIYTDGSCLGNPGPGGWGSVIFLGDQENSQARLEISGSQKDTTNNRMELTAVMESLNMFKEPATIKLVSDSEYVVKGANEWLEGWKKRQWRKSSSNKLVINSDLWQKLDGLLALHTVDLLWTRAHVGSKWNERADELAVQAALIAQASSDS